MTQKPNPAHGGWQFALPFDVRDYECDLQGIVNNAVYQQYLEHARHRYIRTLGLDFAALADQGVRLVVVRAELDYKTPLRSGDACTVALRTERMSPVRFVFHQEIRRTPDGQLVLTARIVCAAMNATGKPIVSDAVDRLFPPEGKA
ncbi:MAG TPA: acyl-CoA thioesterase [bacterium]